MKKDWSEKEIFEQLKSYFPDKVDPSKWNKEKWEKQVPHIQNILAGYDDITVLPTSGGKTLCFLLPGILIPGVTIVISPLVSLMTEQVKELNEKYNIKAACFYASDIEGYDYMTEKERLEIKEEDKKNADMGFFRRNIGYSQIAGGKYKFVYVSPERFNSPHFLELLRRIEVNFIALDEAHCISLWGHNFRPDYVDIARTIKTFRKRPIIGTYSATATPVVQEDIKNLLNLNLKNPEFVLPNNFFIKKNHEYICHKIDASEDKYSNLKKDVEKTQYEWKCKRETLLEILKNCQNKSGIIFCSSYSNIDIVYNALHAMDEYKDRVFKYTGVMKNDIKAYNAEKFLEINDVIMIATNAFGMGINKTDLRFVIHYNFPSDIENYYQETGRAGRDEGNAKCHYLYNPLFENVPFDPFTERGSIKGSVYFMDIIRRKELVDMLEQPDNIGQAMNNYLSNPLNNELINSIKMPPDTLEILKEMEKIENNVLFKTFSKPRSLFANRCIIAERIRKGIYGGEVNAGSKDAKIYYELFYDNKPYSECLDNQKITYFDMMIMDAIYTLELYKKKISAKNIMIILSGDENITLTKRKKEYVDNCILKLMNTQITIIPSNNFYQGLYYPGDNYTFEKATFLPLIKQTDNVYKPETEKIRINVPYSALERKDKFAIKKKQNEIIKMSPLYFFAEKLFQFYSFRSHAMNLRGRNDALYEYLDDYKWQLNCLYETINNYNKEDSDENSNQSIIDYVPLNPYEKELRLYEDGPEHSLENMILTHFLLRRIACLPTQKRVFRYGNRNEDETYRTSNVLARSIRISGDDPEDESIYDYLFKGINMGLGTDNTRSRRGNFSDMNKYSRKRKMDLLFIPCGSGYNILKRLEKQEILEAFKYEDGRLNLMPITKVLLLNILKNENLKYRMDCSLEESEVFKNLNIDNESIMRRKWDFITQINGEIEIYETYNFSAGKNLDNLREYAYLLCEDVKAVDALPLKFHLAIRLGTKTKEEYKELMNKDLKNLLNSLPYPIDIINMTVKEYRPDFGLN